MEILWIIYEATKALGRNMHKYNCSCCRFVQSVDSHYSHRIGRKNMGEIPVLEVKPEKNTEKNARLKCKRRK